MTRETDPKTAEVKVVPVEPTEAMIAAASEEAVLIVREQDPGQPDLTPEEKQATKSHSRRIWSAMLAAAPPAPSGWRSMESAPRDGSGVLVMMKPKVIRLGWYFKPSSRTGGWCDESGQRINPTHWMPLPAEPGATPTPPPAETGEVGWLVESDDNGPLYHKASGTTRNAADALRFARKEDAEAYIRAHGPNYLNSVSTPAWKAVEHRWG